MEITLGVVTHRYWHMADTYYRQPLDVPADSTALIQFWNGEIWAWCSEADYLGALMYAA